MSEKRLQEVKSEIAKMRELHANYDYSNGDQILIQIESRHLDWLVEQVEKKIEHENTLKYIDFQLKNGGYGDRVRIINAVNKALEGLIVESS